MSKIIVIVGPTGVGKTKLSISLAKKYNAEVINADSMQIYKELNIGTAKVSDSEKENIVHHLFDIKDVTEDYTVYDYQKDGRKIIDNLIEKDKDIIIVGGTGLYIKALLYDYKFNFETIKNDYEDLSNEELYNKIKYINENTEVHINNRKRLIRLLNKLENNNDYIDNGDTLLYDNVIFIGLTTNRDKLYEIIDSRVDSMISKGLIDEVKYFYDKNIRSKAIMTGIGYKELYLYFDSEISLEKSIELIKKNSRHYAKRQYTWFNNKMNINWFEVDFNDFNETVNAVVNFIK